MVNVYPFKEPAGFEIESNDAALFKEVFFSLRDFSSFKVLERHLCQRTDSR